MSKAPIHPTHFLRAWRKWRGMTQEALAAKIDVTSGAISQFETGENNFTVPTLEKMAAALGCRPGDILSYSPEEVHGRSDPETRISSFLLSLGVDRKDIETAERVVRSFIPKQAEAQPERSAPDGRSRSASRRRAKEPSP